MTEQRVDRRIGPGAKDAGSFRKEFGASFRGNATPLGPAESHHLMQHTGAFNCQGDFGHLPIIGALSRIPVPRRKVRLRGYLFQFLVGRGLPLGQLPFLQTFQEKAAAPGIHHRRPQRRQLLGALMVAERELLLAGLHAHAEIAEDRQVPAR